MDELSKLKRSVQKKYGDTAISTATEMEPSIYVPSGSLALDFAIGTGGIPHNRVVEIAGTEGAGKTTLGILAMSNFLDKFPERGAAIIDLEHKLSSDWIRMLIGEEKANRVIIVWPDDIEQATAMYREICSSGAISYVLLDSIGGAPTSREQEKVAMGGNTLGVGHFATTASVFSHKYEVCTVGINQAREDMGGYNRFITPGGKKWKHACVLRIQLKPGKDKYVEKINGEDVQIGYSIIAKVIKNQLAAPFRVAWWPFYNVFTEKYGFGIDRLSEIVRLSVMTGVIERKGAWYYHDLFPEGKIQSVDGVSNFLRENSEIAEKISDQVLDAVKEKGTSSVASFGTNEAELSEEDNKITTSFNEAFINGGFK